MPRLTSNNYLARSPIEAQLKTFASSFTPDQHLLDIGCGLKPYKSFFSCEYIGIDHIAGPQVDIVCDSASIPLPDNSFDGIIATQVLEHTADVVGTLREIKRLLKPHGRCFISVPMTVRVHGEPERKAGHDLWYADYWRFTKYGLLLLCRDFTVESIKETSGYLGTILQLQNYFLASFGIPYLFTPLYLLNNLLGKGIDEFIRWLCAHNIPLLQRAYSRIYLGLPLNYCLVIKKGSS